MKKPKCKLTNKNGNVFAIIGNVSNTLKRAGLKEQAKEFTEKAFSAESYHAVIALAFEYVDIS